jgi:exodeoxyribonuclease VII small subunit
MAAPRIDAHDLKAVKSRLDAIVDAVSDDSISLDDALAYYEEAVKLGMKASEIMEADLLGPVDEDAPAGESEPAAPHADGGE